MHTDYSTMILNYITCKKGEIARFKCEATENGLEVKLYKDAKDISFDRHIEEQKEQGYHLSSSNINTIDHEHTSIFVINKTRTALLMVEGEFKYNLKIITLSYHFVLGVKNQNY